MTVKFCDIENYNNDEIKKRISFYAEEKIDGANFRIASDGIGTQFGSRDTMFSSDDNWYNFRKCMESHLMLNKVTELAKSLKQENIDIVEVVVFGELFGGYYPGLQSQSGKIQGNIAYHNNTEFLAYDICIETCENNITTYKYLNEPYMKSLFVEFDIPHLKALKYGGLDELLNMDIRFNSTIPSYFDLPALPEGFKNIVEGIVIKPLFPMYYSDWRRVVIKKKNPEFEERKEKKVKTDPIFSEQESDFIAEVESRITEQRFNTMKSKHPYFVNVEDKNIVGKLINMLTEEFFTDILDDMKRAYINIEYLGNKNVNNMCKRSVMNFIRPYALTMVQEIKNNNGMV